MAAVLLAGTALGGFAVGHAGFAATEATPGAPVNPPGSGMTGHTLPDFTDLVTQVKPAVVSITTKLQASPASDEDQPQMPMPFRGFPFGGMGPQMGPHAHAVEARGSGFIVDANGTIVTNNHVVKDAKTVSVTLDDGTQLPAKVIGRDARTDIAVLKVDAHKQLPYIQLGNSANVKPGQWVVAMGNPFGLGGTVTAGIVSASGRDIGAGPYDQFIQIDAPINQGNSGGPLFTQDGKVIGMNTAILSPSGGSVGIGFAIPSDMIHTVVAQLEKTGKVTRGYIGVEAQQVSDTMAKAMHLDREVRCADRRRADRYARVARGSAAGRRDHRGEWPDGEESARSRGGRRRGAAGRRGEAAGSARRRQQDGVGEGRPVAERADGQQRHRAQQSHERIGLALAPLSPDLRNQLDVPDGTHGVVVRNVEPGSPAEQAGLQAGDVIVGVGDKQVTSPSDAANAIRGASKDHAVALRIIRNGEPIFVGVNLDQNSEG